VTNEQFNALQAWMEAKAHEIACDALGRDTLIESIRSRELEKEARSVLVNEE
jgi:hypothetical protein